MSRKARTGRALAVVTTLPALAVLAASCGSGATSGAASAAGTPGSATAPAPAIETATATATSTVGNIPPAAPAAALAGRTITIDPGHNGGNFTHAQAIARLVPDGNGEKECDTTGTAAPDGYRETDFNWSVALALRALLRTAGARIVMTRTTNAGVGPCVNERAAIGNSAHSDAAISIHADGGPPGGSGFAVLLPAQLPSGRDTAIIAPSRRLGKDMRSQLLAIGLHTSTYDGRDGIAPRTDLGGLNLSTVPKVFVEVANMQNRADEAPMERAAYRERVARALASALERFLPASGG
ncbi:MAG TPA: N-acetylmuramoyl-L-alanine amidase [Solirubrobacteraceae bacterium]